MLEQHGRQIIFDGRPGSLNPLGTVKRIFAGYALSPPDDAIRLHAHQENAATIDTSKARLEKMDER